MHVVVCIRFIFFFFITVSSFSLYPHTIYVDFEGALGFFSTFGLLGIKPL